MAEQEDIYMELDTIAAILHTTVDTVRTYRTGKRNPLKMYKVGRKYLVKKSEFETWMERNEQIENEESE